MLRDLPFATRLRLRALAAMGLRISDPTQARAVRDELLTSPWRIGTLTVLSMTVFVVAVEAVADGIGTGVDRGVLLVALVVGLLLGCVTLGRILRRAKKRSTPTG